MLMYAPVAYDPQAHAPTFEQAIAEMMCEEGKPANKRARVSYIQRTIGYAITGKPTRSLLGIWHGGGANGKSVLCETFLDVLGPYARIIPATAASASVRPWEALHGSGILVSAPEDSVLADRDFDANR